MVRFWGFVERAQDSVAVSATVEDLLKKSVGYADFASVRGKCEF